VITRRIANDPKTPRSSITLVNDGTGQVYESLASWIDDGLVDPTYGLHSSTKSVRGAALTAWTTDAVSDFLLERSPVSEWPTIVKQSWQRVGDAIRREHAEAFAARTA
jgi:putative aldouronate transport system substrate-binding protein